MNRVLSILAALFLAFLTLPTHAGEDIGKTPPEEARQAVVKASALLEAKGVDGARQALYANGALRHGEVFVNVIDMKGIWLVFPPKPAAEGRNASSAQDADGKYLVREILTLANEKGEGWTEYRWKNPATGEVQTKTVYVRAVPSRGVVAFASVYK